MSMYCFCNKIKTFLNLLEKINTPASVSRREAVPASCRQGSDVKKTTSWPRGLCLPGAYRAALVGFQVAFPPLQKATGSSKKETRLMMSVVIFENGF